MAGVLDRDAMAAVVDSLSEAASFQPGDRVKTFKGTLSGVVVAVLDDGRLKWRTDTGSVLIALPETLQRDERKEGNGKARER